MPDIKHISMFGVDADIAVMKGATDTSNGEKGLFPAPRAGDEKRLICGDGTWTDINKLSVVDGKLCVTYEGE